jgi:adenylate cyclase
MIESSKPSIQIDLAEFKLHLHLKNRIQLTLHFNSPSRRFYLAVIALVVNEMKKSGKIKSIPLQEHLDLLVLLNESIGGAAGSSDKENLLPRIYRKWKDPLPNLEEAPLFKVLGKKKEDADGATGKIYSFTDAEKDGWANLFEYAGSEENVRLKFAIDKIGLNLNEISIIFRGYSNGEAWDQFISGLKETGKEESEPEEEEGDAVPNPPAAPLPPPQERKISWLPRNRWIALVAAIGIVLGGIAVWKVYLGPAPMQVAFVDKTKSPLPDAPSLAVLPFVNMSGDPKQEFLSDGITEEIITALSKFPSLLVISRQSTFTYKGKPVKVKQVSEELGVRYVVEGGVQKSGDRVRITVQLVDALTGHHLWAERYDRDLKDIFAMQDEITKSVVTAVDAKLVFGEEARKRARGTENLDAFLKTLEGRYYTGRSSREGFARARQLLDEAISLDPAYPHAYYVLGTIHMMEALSGFSQNPGGSLELSNKMLRKAYELDGSLVMARAQVGYNMTLLRRYAEGVAEVEQAYKLAPNDNTVRHFYGNVLAAIGRAEEAIPILQGVLRELPRPPPARLRALALAQREAGRYEEAIETLKRAVARDPDDIIAQVSLATCYGIMGREEEAHTAAKEVLRLNPKFSIKSDLRTNALKDPAARERSAQALRKAGLPD